MSNAPEPHSPSDLGVLAYRRPPGPEIAAARWLLAWMIINLTFGIPPAGLAGFYLIVFIYNPTDPWLGILVGIIAVPAGLLLLWAGQCFDCRRGILRGDPLSAARAANLCWVVIGASTLWAIVAILCMVAFYHEIGVFIGLGMLLACMAALAVTVAITLRSLRDAERCLRADMPAAPRFIEQVWKAD